MVYVVFVARKVIFLEKIHRNEKNDRRTDTVYLIYAKFCKNKNATKSLMYTNLKNTSW